jgi:hypothetical protein
VVDSEALPGFVQCGGAVVEAVLWISAVEQCVPVA